MSILRLLYHYLNMNDKFKNEAQTVKMIDFIRNLHKKYKVLNKLSDVESNDFQTEIVNLLVDSNQNVDQQTYKDIVNNVGFQAFLLQILGNTINRTPFKNQFQLSRNLDSIAETIKKDQDQLAKRQKIVERKEQKLKSTEEQILLICKQKIISLEAQSLKKITNKQTQIKKSISILIGQLKTKQKMISQKIQIIKTGKATLKSIQQKQRSLAERWKVIQKKERELKSKDCEQLIVNKNNEIQQLQQCIGKLRQSFKQTNLKHKNIELAYKKLKAQNQKLFKRENNIPQQNITAKKSRKKSVKANRHLQQLQNLSFSDIEPQVYENLSRRQMTHKLKLIIKIVSNEKEKKQVTSIINSILGQQGAIDLNKCQISNEESEQQQLQFLKLEQQVLDPHDCLLREIQLIDLDDQKVKQQLIRSDLIINLIQKISALRYPLQICNQFLQMLLPLMEINTPESPIAKYLAKQTIVMELQKMYLCHESHSQIAQSSTLILSRIKLWNDKIKLIDQFKKAIQIRKKIEPQNTILCLNIKYLL